MASENRFVYNPSTVDIGRSKWNMNNTWLGSVYHGFLTPLDITKVMPGDTFVQRVDAFIRTATPPIAPFMDTIQFSIAAFYVPERLVWHKMKEFLGETTDGYGIATEITKPTSKAGSVSVTRSAAVATYPKSLATNLGLVSQVSGLAAADAHISLNPIRSFLQVYNDWFRNENFMPPYLWDHNQTGYADRPIATLNGVNVNGLSDLPRVCKKLDRFTSCLPWAQKASSSVLLPLGQIAPINAGTDVYVFNSPLSLGFNNGSQTYGEVWEDFVNDSALHNQPLTGDGVYAINGSNLYADLSNATAATINQIRMAFATQRYLEALARTGSKYREYIKGIFGVNIGDTTAQMAEYLGGITINLNIDQVLQTTGYSAGSSTSLAAPGAVSVSGVSDYLFTKSFVEPGYVVIVGYAKHDRTYGQGVDELYFDDEIYDEYNPKFANIGEQAISKDNLFFSGTDAAHDVKFGFQEAWSQYRYKKDMVVGFLAPSNTGSFNYWSLADNFGTAPSLNADFLFEDRANIARVLAGGEASPDYFVNIQFIRSVARPMPLYSIPGLIDHH